MIKWLLMLAMAILLSGCALLKIVTVPVKVSTKLVGETADLID